jgi:serine/threonine protein kinase
MEVHELGQSDLRLLHLVAEGGYAHVYFAECEEFSTPVVPVVVKRLKHGNVDLHELLCRMEKLMKIRKENNSAICRVFGAGEDFVGNVWVVMERMAGDLRTLINRRMSYLEDGQMPFDYNNTITMMLDVAQGMEDFHRCGLIHADLKASNILVTPLIMDCGEEVDGWQEISEYFYVKIGDFESSDGVAGTQFWRAPEELQALKIGAKPLLSPAADIHSYGMLCYEILTGRIPFGDCAKSNYDIVLSGKRPELAAHVNVNMKKLLHACWHTDLRQQPGWISIIETLKEELTLHAAESQQPKRRARPRIKIEREKMEAAATTSEMSNLVVTSWEGAVAQGVKFPHRTERFADWKKKNVPKILPEILPIVKVILKLGKAIMQDTYDSYALDGDFTHQPEETTFSEVLSTFDDAWYVVQENWKKHVGREAGKLPPRSTDRRRSSRCAPMTTGRKICPPRRKIGAGYAPMRMVREICVEDALKPCNLLGRTAKYWLKKILATAEEWQIFLTTSRTWRSQNEWRFQKWIEELQEVSSAWEKVYTPFHAWHVRSAIALTALEAVEKKMHSVCREELKSEVR